MALPASPNAISLGQVNTELGISPSTTTISLNQAAVRTLFAISSGAIAMSNGHGKSNASLPPTEYSFNGGDYEVGQTITASFNNPNNTGLGYTVTWTGSNVYYYHGYYARSVTATYSGTLGAGVNSISGPQAQNGSISYYNNGGSIGMAGLYWYSIYFPSLNLTLTNGYVYVNIRGANYQHTVWHDDECCRYGGCNYGCNGYAIEVTSDQTENCCCYDCNGDGITACGNPNDPDYDTSNPPCRAECNPGDPGSACGWSTNYYYNCQYNQGSVVNCPYSTEETTYDILYYYTF